MKKLLPFLLSLALTASLQAAPPTERLVLLVGETEQAQQQAESMLGKFAQRHDTVEVVQQGTKDAERYNAGENASYLFRQIGNEIVWQRPLDNVEQAWTDFQAERYDIPEGKLLSWSTVQPSREDGALRQFDIVEFYAGARPGLQMEITLGGQSIKMEELRPGLYSGGYRVSAEDRVNAQVNLLASDGQGLQETQELGELELQGLRTPRVTDLSQPGYSEWLLVGEAPPGSQVRIDVEIRRGTLFGKRTKRRSAETVADADGKFEAIANLGSLSSSPKGTIKVTAVDANGIESVGPEQEARFNSRVVQRRYWGGGWGGWGGWNRPIFFRRGCR